MITGTPHNDSPRDISDAHIGRAQVLDLAVQALKKRFRSIDIEELRGLEFHQNMQDSEIIEQLGIALQSLARRAFPKLRGTKKFDHLLKGRFSSSFIQMAAEAWSSKKPRRSIL